MRSGVSEDPEVSRPKVRAAQYVRMSTDFQRYSTRNQADAIAVYAACHGFEIVRTYSDEGRSGLTIKARSSLQQLIDDVNSREAEFKAILVYDVSRWGRFQDTDESAHYEFLCRKAGIAVHYCAEKFDNDGSLTAMILKHLKRMMAAEYSRELSTKVYVGQCRLAGLGYRQGGMAGYGLRRLAIDAEGKPRLKLKMGEQKSVHTDRVILVPGPQHEVDTIRRIYRQYITGLTSPQAIANQLNKEGILSERGGPWDRQMIYEVISNEKYIGNNVFNRTSMKLAGQQVFNPRDLWIRVEGAFEAIIDPGQFAAAQRVREDRAAYMRLSDEEMLARLVDLWKRCGGLSEIIISRSNSVPALTTYRNRFGNMANIYERIGYVPPFDFKQLRINAARRLEHPKIIADVVRLFRKSGVAARIEPDSELLIVNDTLRISIVIARYGKRKNGGPDWRLRFEASLSPDFTLAVCLSPDGHRVQEYFLLPRDIFDRSGPTLFTKAIRAEFSAYRSKDLRALVPIIG